MESKTAVVTGGAGFIGSNLCEVLLGKGYSVICVDNLLTGTEKNIELFKSNPKFTFIKWDVINKMPILPKIDFVFHLASPASVPEYQKYDEETALVNSVGTRNLLILTRAYNAKFLFTSTSEIYGDPLEHPQKETYWGNVNPNGIRACYDESKRFGEMITLLYVRKMNVDARVIRIFNTYGPKMRKTDGRVVSNLVNQAIDGRPLTIYGDGLQTRSFCYVSDLVEGLMLAMFRDKTSGEVINLGNPEEYSMLEVAKMVKVLSGSESKITYSAKPPDDPTKRKPDISKAKILLDWTPKIRFEEGLKKVIQYYKSVT